jgi:hypothetical protein
MTDSEPRDWVIAIMALGAVALIVLFPALVLLLD